MSKAVYLFLPEETLAFILDKAFENLENYLKYGIPEVDFGSEWGTAARAYADRCRKIAGNITFNGEPERWNNLAERYETSLAVTPQGSDPVSTLVELRRQVAESAFAKHDFGDIVVVASNCWCSGSSVDEHQCAMSRVIFCEAANPVNPSVKGLFTITFYPETAEVVDVSIVVDGQ